MISVYNEMLTSLTYVGGVAHGKDKKPKSHAIRLKLTFKTAGCKNHSTLYNNQSTNHGEVSVISYRLIGRRCYHS